MQQLMDYQPVTTNLCLKQVLVEQWKMSHEELPISGGWGYMIEDPIIIHEKEGKRIQENLYDSIALEHDIVEKRIDTELMTFRSKEDLFCRMNHFLINQERIRKDSRWYDHLKVRVVALKYSDFILLSAELGKSRKDIRFKDEAFMLQIKEHEYGYETDFWFDITDLDEKEIKEKSFSQLKH